MGIGLSFVTLACASAELPRWFMISAGNLPTKERNFSAGPSFHNRFGSILFVHSRQFVGKFSNRYLFMTFLINDA